MSAARDAGRIWRSPRAIASFALAASLASLAACAGKGAGKGADQSEAPGDGSDSSSRAPASDTPTPIAVCDHVISMMQRELGDDALPQAEVEELRSSCVRDGDEQRVLYVEAAYAAQARCAVATRSLDELQRCEDPEPGASGDAPPPIVVCDHVLGVMRRELGEQLDAMPASELEAIRDECVVEASEERARMGELAYGAQARCVLAARSLDGLEACEDEDDNPARPGPGATRDASLGVVCEHVVDIMKAEFGGGEQQPSDRELREIVDSCTADLQGRSAEVDKQAFEAEIACVMAAASMESLLACDPD